jgi:hypothetical protein
MKIRYVAGLANKVFTVCLCRDEDAYEVEATFLYEGKVHSITLGLMHGESTEKEIYSLPGHDDDDIRVSLWEKGAGKPGRFSSPICVEITNPAGLLHSAGAKQKDTAQYAKHMVKFECELE